MSKKHLNVLNTSKNPKDLIWLPKSYLDIESNWRKEQEDKMGNGSKDYTEEELANNPIFQELIKDSL